MLKNLLTPQLAVKNNLLLSRIVFKFARANRFGVLNPNFEIKAKRFKLKPPAHNI